VIQVAQNNASQSGYGDATGAGAVEEATADVDKPRRQHQPQFAGSRAPWRAPGGA
jgi:hypothetical protein